MYDNLLSIKEKYNNLKLKIEKLSLDGNFNESIPLSKQLSLIEDVVVKFDEYLEIESIIKDAQEIIQNESGKEMVSFAKEEVKEQEALKPAIIAELKILLIPSDPLDEKNVIIEMRGAAGGDEANLFVGDLYDAYIKFCESLGWKTNVLNVDHGKSGGYSNLVFQIEGKKVYSKMKFESGVHRVQRVPQTETQGRVHTSTLSIAVLPEADDVDVVINPSDLKVDTYRASGSGGQHINKSDSAVRITHLPSGQVAACQDGRSQHDNRDKAMKMLKSKLFDLEIEKQNSERSNERNKSIGSGSRSEKIRTYNYPQNRVTDHRIGLTLNSLDKIMEGKLDALIEALITHQQNELLSSSEE